MSQAESESAEPNEKGLVVFIVRRDTKCDECGDELFAGSFLYLEHPSPKETKALCMECAGMDHLEFIGRGDAALTRRATKHSKLKAVVVRWARARNRYERQGILAESAAIEQAEHECLADAEVRQRRQAREAERRAAEDQEFIAAFAKAIREQFPSCPLGREFEIAAHACRKYSGRVGRSAAAKQFSPDAVRLAVIAHIRHAHTRYEHLLAEYGDRHLARQEVQDDIDRVFWKWRGQ